MTSHSLGFKHSTGGAHAARTVMLHELSELLGTADATCLASEHLRDAVIEHNALGKRSARTRRLTWSLDALLRDGFSVLLSYPQLDTKRLETLMYAYLGDCVSRQKQDIAAGVDGAREKLAAAEVLRTRLKLILKGGKPCDIFERWKPLAEQPIGWAPDLKDGVRLNIRSFLRVPDSRKKGDDVLRDKLDAH